VRTASIAGSSARAARYANDSGQCTALPQAEVMERNAGLLEKGSGL
jgi:hypothetical protein